ncbi:ATP-binding protein [Mycoplasmopsis lipophila]|uniref:ATP-binding protein n=1 Tax=Mycoplasmopsis lipophila TaxID=2117 RepID=UPI00387317B7
MLSSEILTQFRDRADEIYVTPLSFKELNEYYKDPNITWKNYIVSGGMPRLIELESFEEKSKYLKTLIEETYLKDIIERKELKSKDEILSTLLNFISSSIGSLTNSLKLEKRFRSEKKISISHSTINNYLSYFEEAYLIKKSKRYDIKGNKYFSTITKYYFTDIGLRNAMLNFRQIEEKHIMENIIYNELIRKGFNVDIGVIEHNASEDNKKIRKQLEIDFVINKENKKYYIQSAFSIPNKDKLIQEIKPLTKINDSFQKIIILKEDIVPRYDEFGIYYIGIKDFLLLEDLFF